MQEIIEKKDAEQSQIQLQITQIEERVQRGTLYLQSIDTEYQRLPEYKEQLLIFQSNISHGLKSKRNMKKQNKYLTLLLQSNRKKNISLHKNKSKYHTCKQLF